MNPTIRADLYRILIDVLPVEQLAGINTWTMFVPEAYGRILAKSELRQLYCMGPVADEFSPKSEEELIAIVKPEYREMFRSIYLEYLMVSA